MKLLIVLAVGIAVDLWSAWINFDRGVPWLAWMEIGVALLLSFTSGAVLTVRWLLRKRVE